MARRYREGDGHCSTLLLASSGPFTLGLALAGAALALWLATPGPAIIINYKPAPLGLVGMTEGQTLRISVAHVIGFQAPPVPDKVCSLQVGFVDRENNTIGDPNVFELRPGSARSFDFVATGDGSVRQYVRPVVVDLNPKEACPGVVSLELLDRGGLNGIIVYDFVALTDPLTGK
jgi:hypothetical protein